MYRIIFQKLKRPISVLDWIVAQQQAKRKRADVRALSPATLRDIGVMRMEWG